MEFWSQDSFLVTRRPTINYKKSIFTENVPAVTQFIQRKGVLQTLGNHLVICDT